MNQNNGHNDETSSLPFFVCVLNSQTHTATNGMSKEDKRNFMCGW
jgi:hypothetical protein